MKNEKAYMIGCYIIMTEFSTQRKLATLLTTKESNIGKRVISRICRTFPLSIHLEEFDYGITPWSDSSRWIVVIVIYKYE